MPDFYVGDGFKPGAEVGTTAVTFENETLTLGIHSVGAGSIWHELTEFQLNELVYHLVQVKRSLGRHHGNRV